MSTDPKFAYRESTARAASPVGRVILLYEQAIHDLSGAVSAMTSQEVEQKTQKISHALLVIGELQACLDLEHGGEVAQNLNRFYDLIRQRLLEAQIKNSVEILRKQVELLLSIRAAWIEVEQQGRQTASAASATAPASSASAGTSASASAPAGNSPTTPPLRWRA